VSSIKVTKAAGLFTSDNPYDTPEGSAAQADNLVIRSKGVWEPRRGQADVGYTFGSSGHTAKEVTFFGTSGIVHTSADALVRDTGAAFSAYTGTYTAPDATTLRMKFAEIQRSLYFTTSAGVKYLESTTATVAAAGLPRGLAIIDTTGTALAGDPSATGTWLPKNSRVAYRYTIIRRDAYGRVIESAPSPRWVLINPADVTASLSVAGTTTVTATVTAHNFRVGDKITISPGGAGSGGSNFGTTGTVTAVTSGTVFTYTDASATGTGALASQTISSGTKAVNFFAWLPSGLSTSHYIRLYRTVYTSADTIDPGDECFLVLERQLTSTEASTLNFVYSDYTPEYALSDIPLYTNAATGDGATTENSQPPLCEDVALWSERQWFSNTTSKHRFTLNILGIGSPNGIQANDLLHIGGVTYTAKTSSPGSSDFLISTQYSNSVNLALTTRSLVEEINWAWGNGYSTCYAIGTSDEDSKPGSILLEESSLGGSAFYVGASRQDSYSPIPPDDIEVTEASTSRTGSTVTVTTAANHGFAVGDSIVLATPGAGADANFPIGTKTIVTTPSVTTFTYTESGAAATMSGTYYVHKASVGSSNDAGANRLYYSKLQQPEAVPVLNYLDVGAKNYAILRIIPLRDKLFVFKEDGLFTVSGEYPFRVDALDTTVKLFAPDSVATVSNRIFALTTQGFVMATEGGAAIISRPIEAELLTLMQGAVAGFKAACFGVGYETERSYLCWMPDSAGGSSCKLAYIYNVLTNTWTKRTDWRTCGRVSPADYLYLGAVANATSTNTTNTLTKERKSLTYVDNADESFTKTLSSFSGSTLTLNSTTGITAGDLLVDAGDLSGVVTSVPSGTTVTVSTTSLLWTAGTVTIYRSIPNTLVYNPVTGGAPGIMKHFREMTFHFGGTPLFNYGYLTSFTEFTSTAVSDVKAAAGSELIKNMRTTIPRQAQRAALFLPGLTLREARTRFKLYGFTLEADAVSERNSR
jgi:hypothetical protein